MERCAHVDSCVRMYGAWILVAVDCELTCKCVRACVRAGVRACVCVRARARVCVCWRLCVCVFASQCEIVADLSTDLDSTRPTL